jgi:hypothetical protein
VVTRQDFPKRAWDGGQIGGDKGIPQQLIAITKMLRRYSKSNLDVHAHTV